MYITRALEKVVLETSEAFPVVLVTGPRQVGKTTMLKRLAQEDRSYVTLDSPTARSLAISEPELFLQRYAAPVLIDEIQYAPELLPYIKMHVDESGNKGDFWLTGSQMFKMMSCVSESLAGRVGILAMEGFSSSELAAAKNVAYQTDFNSLMAKFSTREPQTLPEVFGRIFKGSQPALYQTEQDIPRYYESYIDTYLKRDIRDLSQVGDELSFMRFMTACANRTSQMVNYTDIAKDVGITAPTARQWLSLLVSSGLVVLVEPFFNNRLKRAIKSPNMYFMDTGLCAHLAKWPNAEVLESSASSGAFFETYAVSEIVKSYYNAGTQPPILYYRDKEGREIDLLLEQGDTVFPIEIKKTAHPKKEDIKNFSAIKDSGKQIGHGNVICMCQDLLPIDKDNTSVPVWLI